MGSIAHFVVTRHEICRHAVDDKYMPSIDNTAALPPSALLPCLNRESDYLDASKKTSAGNLHASAENMQSVAHVTSHVHHLIGRYFRVGVAAMQCSDHW